MSSKIANNNSQMQLESKLQLNTIQTLKSGIVLTELNITNICPAPRLFIHLNYILIQQQTSVAFHSQVVYMERVLLLQLLPSSGNREPLGWSHIKRGKQKPPTHFLCEAANQSQSGQRTDVAYSD